MARIAYVLLAHRDPEGVVAQARRLTAAGDVVAIHFDANAPAAQFETIRKGLAANDRVTFAARRIRCGWGEWSLVAATLEAVRAALAAFPAATHVYMISGDCMPIKSAEYIHAWLDRSDADHIESFDFFNSGWIKTGMREERLIFRHYLNERRHKRLFYASLEAQRRLGLRRRIPEDIDVMIGSQWWCLRRATLSAILDFVAGRPDIAAFFRTTWIPDETFFQTLVPHLVPDVEIRRRTPTFLLFSDYGMPVTFYNDHHDLLLSQDFLFARKISPEAAELKERLGELYATRGATFRISDEGRRLHGFLTGRGRIGRRFAPRFWETEGSLGRERELLIIACKKWHVAKRLAERIRRATGLPAVDYLFNEETTPLPDLGGIQTTIEKRTRHRRALMRLLFDWFGGNRLVMCLDTANIELLNDFYADKATSRLLEVQCAFSDDYLIGHARRVGLAGWETPASTVARLLPTLRYDIRFESEQIRDAGFAHVHRLYESAPAEQNTAALAAFLGIAEATARGIIEAEGLFHD
ncbi:MAG: glycosyl transferase [Rhodobacteraceae bacterium]|nr:glycosyl transferase [Paracoccaceae bacterium]